MRLGLADVFNDPTLLSMDTFEMKMIEKFVVLKFSKSCDTPSDNDVRCILFTKNLKP